MMHSGNSEGEAPGSLGRVLPPLLLLTFIFLLNFMSRVIFSPLLPEIEQDLGLDHATAGSFFLFISSGYFISILLSGLVSVRIGHKYTIILSSVCSGVVLIGIGMCESLLSMQVCLFCLGYTAGLYLPSGIATIAGLVSPSHLARGMAVHELAPNLGFVFAPLLTALILQFASWREGLQLTGLVLIGVGLLYKLVGENDKGKSKTLNLLIAKQILALPQFWAMVLFFSMAICSTLGIYAMLPLYLVAEQGFEQDSANHLVSMSRISSVFMPLLGAWVGDRFGNKKVMLSVLFCAGLLTIPIGLMTGKLLILAIILQPMVAVCFFPSGFAILSRLGGAAGNGGGVSLCIPLAFLIGGGAIPALMGIAGDMSSLGVGFLGVGFCTACLALGGRWMVRRFDLS